MRVITSLSLLALGLLAGVAPVRAADIIEPIIEVPIATSGWYLRGDVGYNSKDKTTGRYKFWNEGQDENGNFPGPIGQGVDDEFSYDEIKLRDGASFGVGAGYRFSDQFRADVTADYFSADVNGKSDCNYIIEADTFGISPINSGCRYDDRSKADIWTVMANAYVDVGHFGPVTPYIGAGAGFAHVSYDTMDSTIVCGPQCPDVPDYKSTHPGLDDWRFAASLMAGATFDLTSKLQLDAGYRYTRISEGDAFGYDERDRAANATGVQGRDDGFDIHTVRAGLRYNFF